jgi:class 3 adenylate cyclase/CheY-like chemotaxis protein
MRTPPLILIVDDNAANVEILQMRLMANNYEIITATDGEKGLAVARESLPDLILLDIMMPKIDGLEVCRLLKNDPALPFMPIIMVTAKADSKDIIAGLDAGGDEYLTKPVDQGALVARVKSMLRIKNLHDRVKDQTLQLEKQADELKSWNTQLEERVKKQVEVLERTGRLKRFLSPQLAELIISSNKSHLLNSHRQEVTVVFCDLRGFTAFSELGEPEEVMGVLQEYHTAMGKLIFEYGGTLERFAGDGLMVFFNDPIPCDDPSEKAVKMAMSMRETVATLNAKWKRKGYNLGFGIGIDKGFATLGKIGFEGRFDYAAIGTVTNTASRLCDNAQQDQILISQKVWVDVEDIVNVEKVGDLLLKGLHRSIIAYNIL